MAETEISTATSVDEQRWAFITRGFILLVLGILGIFLWPSVALVGMGLLGVFIGMVLIIEGLMTMAVSILMRDLKYWWVVLMAGSVSLLSAAIILVAGENIEMVTRVIAGWYIFRALFALSEGAIFKGVVKSLWPIYVESFLLIVLAAWVIRSLVHSPEFITFCIGYFFIIYGTADIILSLFVFKGHEPLNSGELQV